MAVTRSKPAPDTEAPDTTAMVAALARILSRYLVSQGYGTGSLTFRQVVTAQLRIATDAEVDTLEAWMAHHAGG